MESKVDFKDVIVNEKITVFAENKRDSISFNISDLIYITTQGNYASFYCCDENGLKEMVLRNSLIRIANQLQDFTNIKRCHKSYIINKTHMKAISGNARGYYLESNLLSMKIPISRNLKKEEIENLIH